MSKISKILLILFFIVVAIIGVFTLVVNYTQFQNGTFSTTLNSETDVINPNAQICKSNKGIWYSNERVCEVNAETCNIIGGHFDECAIKYCEPSEEVTNECATNCKAGCMLDL